MVGSRAYDFMYRVWAPWDSVGVRSELKTVLDRGLVSVRTHPRAIDLGCGTGSNVVHLAGLGFDAHGVDFSSVALDKARARAAETRVTCTFVLGDLTVETIPEVKGAFDLLLDFGTLDDLRGEARQRMALTIERLARPGSVLIEWCFYGAANQLPLMSFTGPSRLTGSIEPGELEAMFGERWDIDELRSDPEHRVACFVLTHH